jgi:hypothetical protein
MRLSAILIVLFSSVGMLSAQDGAKSASPMLATQYVLKSSKAEEVAAVIKSVYRDKHLCATVNKAANTLTVATPPELTQEVAGLINALDEAAGRTGTVSVVNVEKSDGFVSLFNGGTLDGWQGDVKNHRVENGAIVRPRERGGNLVTNREYADFILRFDFKLEAGANNGIGIRTLLKGDAAYVGMEIQILDDGDKMYKNLKPYQYCGSIYGVVPAERGHLKPVGEWNSEEILCQGRHVKVTLNGAVIVDADLDKVLQANGSKTIDGHAHPGLKRTKGYIALLGHTYRVEFRNLRIKEL